MVKFNPENPQPGEVFYCDACPTYPKGKCDGHVLANGTTYDARTPEIVRQKLETIRISGKRVRLYYGDTETGRCWGDGRYDGDGDEVGRISRSMGPMKVPLCVHNSRSTGGSAVLDSCIVRISPANKLDGYDYYRHPKFHYTTTEDSK